MGLSGERGGLPCVGEERRSMVAKTIYAVCPVAKARAFARDSPNEIRIRAAKNVASTK